MTDFLQLKQDGRIFRVDIINNGITIVQYEDKITGDNIKKIFFIGYKNEI